MQALPYYAARLIHCPDSLFEEKYKISFAVFMSVLDCRKIVQNSTENILEIIRLATL